MCPRVPTVGTATDMMITTVATIVAIVIATAIAAAVAAAGIDVTRAMDTTTIVEAVLTVIAIENHRSSWCHLKRELYQHIMYVHL